MRQPITFNKNSQQAGAPVGGDLKEEEQLLNSGAACSLTKRVMVVSPFPERLHSLLRLLTAECFDLFTLHDLNKGFVSSLQPELILYDAMPHPQLNPNAVEAFHTALLQTEHLNQMPILYLIVDEANVAVHSLPEGTELLVWPTDVQEALGRINAILEQYAGTGKDQVVESAYTFKDLTIDLKRMTLYRGLERIDLTKTEYELLLQFVTSDGAVLSREALFDSVWGSQFLGGSNVVDVHIKTLRKKLKDSAVAPKYIVTVRGAGYRLADDIKE